MMNKSFLKTYSDIQDWLKGKDLSTVAFDTETEGLKYGSPIVGLSLCNGQDACYINLIYVDEFENEKLLWLEIQKIFYSASVLIAHNIKFDLKVLRSKGIEPTCNLYDTMVASHLLNENKPCDLKSLMERKLQWKNVKEWKEVAPKGFDSHEFEEYGIKDSIATWKLYEMTKPLIEKNGFHDLFYNIEMPFQRVLVDLECSGIEIDQKYLEDLDDTLAVQRNILEIKCVESLGLKMVEEKNLWGLIVTSPPVNFNSPKQLIDIIQNKLKLELPYQTDKGNPSTGKDSLFLLKGRHPFIDNLLEWRKVEKLYNTFVHPMWDYIDPDGRIRPSFNDCVAVTGRLSSSKPNGQNLPKGKKTDTYKIRKMFRAKKGCKLVHADFSGQELRVCAVASKDQNMIDAFLKDKDLHLTTANEWLQLAIPEECLYKSHPDYKKCAEQFDDERQVGKNGVNFPIIYGTTARGIAINNNISEEKAQAGIDAFFRLYPNVKRAINQCRKDLIRDKCVVTMLGRKRRIEDITPKAIRQAFNSLIQGFCVDLLRIVMVALRDEFLKHPEWDAQFVLTVHDSVDVEIKEQFAQGASIRIKDIMENTYKFPIPLPVDIKILEYLE
jgi:DNA polymerase-1